MSTYRGVAARRQTVRLIDRGVDRDVQRTQRYRRTHRDVVEARRGLSKHEEMSMHPHTHTHTVRCTPPCCGSFVGSGDDGSGDDGSGDDGSGDDGSGDDGSLGCDDDEVAVVLVLTILYLEGDDSDSFDDGLSILTTVTIVINDVKSVEVCNVIWVDWGGNEVCHGT